jgi:hypothetical protein
VNSGGHRGFTTITIVTLIFAPLFAHHHWMWRLVGKTKDRQIVQCVKSQPCPHHLRIVNIVTLPQPPSAPPQGSGSENGDTAGIVVDDPNSVVVSDDGDNVAEPAVPKQH